MEIGHHGREPLKLYSANPVTRLRASDRIWARSFDLVPQVSLIMLVHRCFQTSFCRVLQPVTAK
jgi:hypothetical protein